MKTDTRITGTLREDRYNNNGYFTWRPIHIFGHVFLSYSKNEKCFERMLIKTKQKNIFCSIIFLIVPFMRKYGKKYTRPGLATMTIWCMWHACWKRKCTNTHSEYVILLLHCDSGYANVPQVYVIRLLPVFCGWFLYFLKVNADITAYVSNWRMN